MALNSMPAVSSQRGGRGNKIFFILGGIVILAFFVYLGLSFFGSGKSQEGAVVSNTSGVPKDQTAQVSQELDRGADDIIKAVNLINTVRIETDFFWIRDFLL